MSSIDAASLAISTAAPRKRVITASSLFGTVAVSTLIGSQLVTVMGAFVYSLVVLFRLSQAVTIGLSVVSGAVSLWALGMVVLLAFRAETDPENN